jgi:fructokinase
VRVVPSPQPRLTVVAGEALVDLVTSDGEVLRAHPGGGPFNTARTIARLEQPVAYLGRLSTDRFGAVHARLLAEDGVRLDAVVRTDEPSTLAIAEFDGSAGTAYRFYAQGTAAPGLTEEAALAALPGGVTALHVGTLGLVFEPVGRALEAVVGAVPAGTLVALDPNIRPSVAAGAPGYRERLERLVARADLVKVSEEDLAWLDPGRDSVDAARALLDRGPRVVLLTRGGDGALVLTPHGADEVAAAPVTVVDTIGAGDAFGGGFLAWWSSRGLGAAELDDRAAVVEATRFAVLVAARTVARAGASPPRLAELGGVG